MTEIELARFEAKVERLPEAPGCWIWMGALSAGGGKNKYGRTENEGKTELAHRVSYKHWRGPIPAGYHLDHRVCKLTCCINPWHTLPVTPRENALVNSDSLCVVNLAKTHCPRGHSYMGNYVRVDGRRKCRDCDREKLQEKKARPRVH